MRATHVSRVRLEEQLPFDEPDDGFAGTLGRSLGLAEDHAVVGVANEAMAPLLQLAVKLVEHDVR